jgi:hypothetical protein
MFFAPTVGIGVSTIGVLCTGKNMVAKVSADLNAEWAKAKATVGAHKMPISCANILSQYMK